MERNGLRDRQMASMTLGDPRFLPAPIGFLRGVRYDITDADDAFLAMVGYTRDDLASGRISWREMTPPELLHLDEAGMTQARESGGFTAPYQKEFFRKDGSRVKVLLVCAFVPRREGEWIGYVVDLSSPPQAAARAEDMTLPLDGPLPHDIFARLVGELVRERGRMLHMLDNTPAMMWAVDPNVRLLGANAAFMTAQRSASGVDVEIGTDLLSDIYPLEMRAGWAEWYARALAGEHVNATRTYRLDDRVAHIEYQLSPIVGPDGSVAGATIISLDQTTRIETEARLRASDARFTSLAVSLPVGIFVADAGGRLTYMNPRLTEIMGASEAALVGHGYVERILPEHLSRLRCAVSSAIDRGESFDAAFEIRRLDGQVRSVRCQARRADVDDPESVVIGSIEDETERLAQAERERRRQTMESLGTLAGGIAHDFNNMLGVILGFAELAATKGTGGEVDLEALDGIRTASLRARELVQRILAFSRRTEQRMETLDLGRLVEESARLLRAAIPASVVMDVVLPPLPVRVRGDAAALQQVVVNLCTNAEHALRRVSDPKLVVALEIASVGSRRCARLVVRDNGLGIPRDVLARVFEPFFTTKEAGEGTGMGLAMVHGIVTSHEGEIHVTSSPGAGATFTITLPTVDSATPQPPAKEASEPPTSGGRILLVEDEAAVGLVTMRVLTRAGYSVTSVTSAQDALDILHADPGYDLVLTDFSMPGMRGDELARVLGKEWPELRCLLMSGYRSDLRVDDIGGSAETRSFLSKPFSVAELSRAVGALMPRPT